MRRSPESIPRTYLSINGVPSSKPAARLASISNQTVTCKSPGLLKKGMIPMSIMDTLWRYVTWTRSAVLFLSSIIFEEGLADGVEASF